MSRHTVIIQLAQDYARTSPKGPNVRDLQGTFKGLSWERLLNLWLAFVFHIYSCLLQEKQIFRCSNWGRRRDVYGFQMRNSQGQNNVIVLGHPWDDGQTWFLTMHKQIKLTLNLLRFDLRVLKFDLRNLS